MLTNECTAYLKCLFLVGLFLHFLPIKAQCIHNHMQLLTLLSVSRCVSVAIFPHGNAICLLCVCMWVCACLLFQFVRMSKVTQQECSIKLQACGFFLPGLLFYPKGEAH